MMTVISQTEVFSGRASMFGFQDALENIGMGTSEDSRNEIFRRAQQSEIEMALLNVQGIEDATVILNLSDPRALFLGNMPRPSAAVTLETQRTFNAQDSMMLASMVANAVEGLDIDFITITDQNLRTIFNGSLDGDERFGTAMLGGEVDHRALESARAEAGVMELFSNMFHIVDVSAQVAVQTDSVSRVSTEFSDPSNGAGGFATNRETVVESATGTAPQGQEPGLGPNAGVPAFAGAQTGDTEASREAIYESNILVNQVTESVEVAAGQPILDQSSIAVVVSTRQVYDQAVMESNGLLPEGVNWDMFVMQNSLPIADVNADVPALSLMVASSTGIPVENVSLIAQIQPVFVPIIQTPTNWNLIILLSIMAALLMMLAYALIRTRKVEEEIIEIEPELSVEDLLVSTRIEEAAEEEAAASLQEIAYGLDSEVKQQIEKFVNEKPEAVAQLIRSWMNEGWE